MEFTARFGLHSQTTRLVDSASWCDRVRARRSSYSLRCPLPGDLGPRVIPPDLGSRSEHLSAKGSWRPDARRAVAATANRVELQPPLFATSVDVDSHLGQLRARGAWEASIRPATTTHPMIEVRCEGATRCVTPRQTCPRPNGFGPTCVQRLYGSRDSAIHTKRSTGPPDARRGWGARGRLSIQVLLSAFCAGVRWSPAGARAGDWGRRSSGVLEHPARADSQLLNMFAGSFCCAGFDNDPSAALASMKNIAKCDTWCELQNPVNHRVFECKLRPKPLGRGHVCLGVTHRVAPSHRASITGRVVVAGRILASRAPRACGWPKCESTSTDVAESGGCNSTLFAVTATAHPASGLQDPFALRRSDRDPRSGGITR
ncbi:hypothetical protein CQW23_34188 [Capsicum baccatum]|uniref:Uncharacterized protein n=1 Tax=Capsicum baccatum TaxID=33114 RepID=A0A2G2UZY2_CAPBA|nr:hypothetical protein CQW23_34188 [Capsicum baccatum]